MDELICKNCGHSVFIPLKDNNFEYKCLKCKELTEYKGNKKHFLTLTDNEIYRTIINLGYDLLEDGLKSDAMKVAVTIAVSSCLTNSIVSIGAVAFLVGSIPGILKIVTENILFTEKTLQQQFTDLFNKILNKHLNLGKKKKESPDYQFKLYYKTCEKLSALILQNINEKKFCEDFFNENTISHIYFNLYTDNPTQEEFENIISVSKEIMKEYREAVFSNPKLKEAYEEIQRKKEISQKIEYLSKTSETTAVIISNMQERFEACENILKHFSIKADNKDYLSVYFRELFLEKEENSPLTLGSIYIDPSVEGYDIKASELINYWFENDKDHTTLLMYGSAGVGKSSLCSKLIADAAEIERESDAPTIFNIPVEKIHIKALRKCVKILKDLDYNTVDELIEAIFAPSGLEINYSGDLFVLDGLDELAVLCPSFNIPQLFDKLYYLSTKKYKILITSRKSDGYNRLYSKYCLRVESLEWHEDDMTSWCEKYSELKNDQRTMEWCALFKEFYEKLEGNDKRREVFSVPVILYIAAAKEINFSENLSLCQIYDKAFNCLLERNHIKNTEGNEAFSGNINDEKLQKIYWQYTKELAFQMLLSKELILSLTDEEDDSQIKRAQKMTWKMLGTDETDLDDKRNYDIDNAGYLAVFQFARSDENGQSIEFVHKTVYEYFTAVKLFEDYFKNMTTECSYEDVWSRIVRAFRYVDIDPDIMKYLAEMMLSLDSSIVEHFFESVHQGMSKYEIYHQFMVDNEISEYKDGTDSFLFIKSCFSNLIRILSFMGYVNNYYKNYDRTVLQFMLDKKAFDECFKNLLNRNKQSSFDFSNWNLYGIDIRGTDVYSCCFANAELSYADFSASQINNERIFVSNNDFYKVKMEYSKLIGTTIKYCTFHEAKMNSADMKSALIHRVSFRNAELQDVNLSASEIYNVSFENSDLRGAKLNGAKISSSNFKNSDLRGADLRGVTFYNCDWHQSFRGAKYNKKGNPNTDNRITRFPKWFKPEKYGMNLDNS